jgi:flagellar basal-body rod protein FlgF
MANASTVGFKLENQIVETMPRDSGRDEIVYPLDRGSYTDQAAGPITLTGNPLDVAIEGEGFLAVETADGVRYTRDGRMTRDAQGTLIGSSGDPILADGGGTIEIPETARQIVIAGDGTVTVDEEEVGRLAVFALDDQSAAARGPDGLYASERAEPLPTALLRQGALEQSNVQPVRELVDLMELHRGYERMQSILDDEDQRIRKLVANVVRV